MRGEAVSPADLERLRAVVRERLGLTLDERRDDELAETLRARLGWSLSAFRRDASREGRVASYLDALESRSGGDAEIHALGRALTVGETYFFRVREHFEVLDAVVIPARPWAGGLPRILSLGCSTGEEPYSLAIFFHPEEGRSNGSIVQAVDLNREALDHAERGLYSEWALRETPPMVRERWFRRQGGRFLLADEIQQLVAFGQGNITDVTQPIAGGPFDVVFCRNVLMYFTPEATREVVARLARLVAPGGFLFLGPAESLRGLAVDFETIGSHGTFYYRRRGGRPIALDERPPAALAPSPTPARTSGERPAVPRGAAPEPPPAPATEPPRARLESGPLPSAAFDEALDLLGRERFVDGLRALDADPALAASPHAHVLRAVLLLGSGAVAEAEAVCRRLLAEDAQALDVEAHAILGLTAEHRGDVAEALAQHRAVLYLDPDFSLSHLHLARLERRSGRIEEARRELRQAAALLEHETDARLLLFGGGFSRASLLALCRSELAALGGDA